MTDSLFLGLDTSCYTTSAVLLNQSGQVVGQARRLLKVRSGARGLSQSEMVFQHVRNLPEIFQETMSSVTAGKIRACAASVQPRRLEDSYMPVFLVSKGYGQTLAQALGVPFYELSHQENHLWAGLFTAGGPEDPDFLAVHLSGGTTELLQVSKQGSQLGVRFLGGTTDIAAGQLIDRVGVRLGLTFPAGPHLEILARQGEAVEPKLLLPISLKAGQISFAGPETQVQRWLEQGYSHAQIAWSVEQGVARAVAKLIEMGMKKTGLKQVLMAGGVASNQHIRDFLSKRICQNQGQIFLTRPEYSSDHALGCAVRAWLAEREKQSPHVLSKHKL